MRAWTEINILKGLLIMILYVSKPAQLSFGTTGMNKLLRVICRQTIYFFYKWFTHTLAILETFKKWQKKH